MSVSIYINALKKAPTISPDMMSTLIGKFLDNTIVIITTSKSVVILKMIEKIGINRKDTPKNIAIINGLMCRAVKRFAIYIEIYAIIRLNIIPFKFLIIKLIYQ